MHGGMANSEDPDQIWVCTICIWHFVRNFGVQNFRTFTIHCGPTGLLTFKWNSEIGLAVLWN